MQGEGVGCPTGVPVLSVNDDGVIRTGSEYGTATVLIENDEDFSQLAMLSVVVSRIQGIAVS